MSHSADKGWTASHEMDFHHSATFMDYLHGDVKDGEAELACFYEYARESKDMWEAAKLRDKARMKWNMDCEAAYWRIYAQIENWIYVTAWAGRFLRCESFPKNSWKELSNEERKQILRYERQKVEPLQIPDVHYGCIDLERFSEFKKLAADTKPIVEDHDPQSGKIAQPPKLVPAMRNKDGSVYYCLFMLDFSESPKRLSQQFGAWLNEPSIKLLWRRHREERTREPRKPLRLKRDFRWGGTRGYWCLFEVNLSAGKTDLAKHFRRWVGLPKNRDRLKQLYAQKRGKADKWKDLLKDLAAWRLYREITNQPKAWMYANEYACVHRKTKLVAVIKGKPAEEIPRPFHNAKAKGSVSRERADLFGDPSEASDAAKNAWKFLCDSIPSEFKKPNPELMKEWEKLEK